MVEPVTASAGANWLGFAGSLFGGGLGGSAPPSTAISEGSTVTVGGLNVPAYPNFPLLQNNAGAIQQPTVTQAVNNNGVYLIAGVVLVVALLVKKK